MNNRAGIIVLVIAIILVAGYLYTDSGAIVTAQGTSVIEVSPDKASVNLYIETKGDTAQIAKERHDEILDALIVALLKEDVLQADIQTSNFNVYPNYVWEDETNKQKGFVARQDILVKNSEFDNVAEIVDAAINSGALVSYINFELSDEKQSEYKIQALEEAGEDARKKAEATASGLDKKLGKLVSVESQDFNYVPYPYFKAESMDASGGIAVAAEARQAAVDLTPRDIEVSATLTVQYKLRSF